MAEESLLQQAFAGAGEQLDRIINAYERKENSGYPYYIKFGPSQGFDPNDDTTWNGMFDMAYGINGISSVVWKVNSPEMNDFDSNIQQGNLGESMKNNQVFYYGYLLFMGKEDFDHLDAEMQETYKENMRNGTFTSGAQLEVQNFQLTSNNFLGGTVEICDASEF